MKKVLIAGSALLLGLAACRSKTKTEQTVAGPPVGTFAYDQVFLQNHHKDVVVLRDGDAQALVLPAYQGRVMTSTADGKTSYGWINYDLIRSGKLLPHMNAFGGEDRFWMGPEGGQYAIFFKKGDAFTGDNWQTPAPIDSEPFTLVTSNERSARFSRNFQLTNYAGTAFNVGLEREVRLLSRPELAQLLEIPSADGLKMVGVQSNNTLINRGQEAWTPDKGLLSVWILGMFNASPRTTVIVPFRKGSGAVINDSYFGKVPVDRLVLKDTVAYFKADAKLRSKIGVSPDGAKNWLGSYDPATQTLTLVTYTFDPANRQYVNSMWEQQKNPYGGDVVNSYNDGPMKPGQPQMGQFYELETSSPAAALAPGNRLIHTHTTMHIQGSEAQLAPIAQRLLGASLPAIQQVFSQ
ncbi:hypothetical protein GCM10023189_24010 [Nibrella saemangeumensis]|uniref:Lipoprotein n=1 Tax=Nibrella saemangeumensis TaxID=1084526 RepID=A0ABP8MWZ0_9BACT